MFTAHDASLELIRELRTLMPAIQRFDRDLATQLRTAATSVTLNLSEGQRSGGRGAGSKIRHARAILDRLLALLWRLTHPRHRVSARPTLHHAGPPKKSIRMGIRMPIRIEMLPPLRG